MEVTEWEGKFTADHAWRRARASHPEHFVPSQAKDHEDCQAEWLTMQNINDQINNHKNTLLTLILSKMNLDLFVSCLC